jgi:NADH dehydrogenase (ubiquinone) 1 alpha subcomplex subunit 6
MALQTPTIPSRLAQAVKIARTHDEARARVLSAYRHWYRSAPEICALYALNVSPSAIRLKIREDFERARSVSDLKVINVLLHKNWVEYQETMNCWKQEVSPNTEREGGRRPPSTRPGQALTTAPPHALVQLEQPAKPETFRDK